MANELSLPRKQYQFGRGAGSYQPVNTDLLTYGDDTDAQRLARSLGSSGFFKGLAKSFKRHQEEVESAYSKSLLETAKSHLLNEYENFVTGLSDPSKMMLDPAKYMSEYEDFHQRQGGELSSSIDNQVSLTEFNTFKNEVHLTYRRKVNLLQQKKKIQLSEATLNNQAASRVAAGDFDWFNKPETISWVASIMGGPEAGIWAAEQEVLAKRGRAHVNINKMGTIRAADLMVGVAEGTASEQEGLEFLGLFTYEENGVRHSLLSAQEKADIITETINESTNISNYSNRKITEANQGWMKDTVIACGIDATSPACLDRKRQLEAGTGGAASLTISEYKSVLEQIDKPETGENSAIVRSIEHSFSNKYAIHTNDDLTETLDYYLRRGLIGYKYWKTKMAELKDRDMAGAGEAAIASVDEIADNMTSFSTIMLEAMLEKEVGVKGTDEAKWSELQLARLALEEFRVEFDLELTHLKNKVKIARDKMGASWTADHMTTYLLEEFRKTKFFKEITAIQAGTVSGFQKIISNLLGLEVGMTEDPKAWNFFGKLIDEANNRNASRRIPLDVLRDPVALVTYNNANHLVSLEVLDHLYDIEGIGVETEIGNFLKLTTEVKPSEMPEWNNPNLTKIKHFNQTVGGRNFSSATFFAKQDVVLRTAPPSLKLGVDPETGKAYRSSPTTVDGLPTVVMGTSGEVQVLGVVFKDIGSGRDRTVEQWAKVVIGGDIARQLGMSGDEANLVDWEVWGAKQYARDNAKIDTITRGGIAYEKTDQGYKDVLEILTGQTYWVKMNYLKESIIQ